jgi:hypothetical protein
LLEQWVRQSQQQPDCQRVIVGAMGAAIAATTRMSKSNFEQWMGQSQQESGCQRVIVGAMGAAIAATTRLSKGDCWGNGCGYRSKNQAVKG